MTQPLQLNRSALQLKEHLKNTEKYKKNLKILLSIHSPVIILDFPCSPKKNIVTTETEILHTTFPHMLIVEESCGAMRKGRR